jgi:two-component system NarL family response regulator
LIVDDHPVVRAGLETLLRKEGSLRIVGSADSAEQALEILSRARVDVILLDLRMPRVSGLDFLPMLKKLPQPPEAIILSSYEFEEEIYRAMRAGAAGYLSKNASRTDISAAIAAVSAGETYFPASIARRIEEHETRSALTLREKEIIGMVAKGLTNKEIGRVLNISQFTVRNHINHISAKLDVSDRTEAVTVALRLGIIFSTD